MPRYCSLFRHPCGDWALLVDVSPFPLLSCFCSTAALTRLLCDDAHVLPKLPITECLVLGRTGTHMQCRLVISRGTKLGLGMVCRCKAWITKDPEHITCMRSAGFAGQYKATGSGATCAAGSCTGGGSSGRGRLCGCGSAMPRASAWRWHEDLHSLRYEFAPVAALAPERRNKCTRFAVHEAISYAHFNAR